MTKKNLRLDQTLLEHWMILTMIGNLVALKTLKLVRLVICLCEEEQNRLARERRENEKNNIETSKDVKQSEKRIRLAEERNDQTK